MHLSRSILTAALTLATLGAAVAPAMADRDHDRYARTHHGHAYAYGRQHHGYNQNRYAGNWQGRHRDNRYGNWQGNRHDRDDSYRHHHVRRDRDR